MNKKRQNEAVDVNAENQTKTEQVTENKNKFVPPTAEQTKGAWGRSKATTTTTATTNETTTNANPNPNTNTTGGANRGEPELVFKGATTAKKDDKKSAKGKGW